MLGYQALNEWDIFYMLTNGLWYEYSPQGNNKYSIISIFKSMTIVSWYYYYFSSTMLNFDMMKFFWVIHFSSQKLKMKLMLHSSSFWCTGEAHSLSSYSSIPPISISHALFFCIWYHVLAIQGMLYHGKVTLLVWFEIIF